MVQWGETNTKWLITNNDVILSHETELLSHTVEQLTQPEGRQGLAGEGVLKLPSEGR